MKKNIVENLCDRANITLFSQRKEPFTRVQDVLASS